MTPQPSVGVAEGAPYNRPQPRTSDRARCGPRSCQGLQAARTARGQTANAHGQGCARPEEDLGTAAA
eukprot:1790829-Pyramimonas_sp.AAC.1